MIIVDHGGGGIHAMGMDRKFWCVLRTVSKVKDHEDGLNWTFKDRIAF